MALNVGTLGGPRPPREGGREHRAHPHTRTRPGGRWSAAAFLVALVVVERLLDCRLVSGNPRGTIRELYKVGSSTSYMGARSPGRLDRFPEEDERELNRGIRMFNLTFSQTQFLCRTIPSTTSSTIHAWQIQVFQHQNGVLVWTSSL